MEDNEHPESLDPDSSVLSGRNASLTSSMSKSTTHKQKPRICWEAEFEHTV